MPKRDLVEMAAGDLDYSIRNKFDTQYLRYMVQLADRFRQVKRPKAEKARIKSSEEKRLLMLIQTKVTKNST